MANNLDVTAITGYVEEHKVDLIERSVEKDLETAKMFKQVPDVLGKTSLPILNTNVVIQNGKTCGFTASGSTAITERMIEPKILKVNMEWCYKDFADTFANYKTRIDAGDEVLAFSEDFVNDVVRGAVKANEEMLWQGDAANDNEYDGLLTILSDDVPSGNTAALTVGTAAYDGILKAYNLLPNRAIDKDTYIFVSTSLYRQFIQELVAKNLYHFKAEEGEPKEIFLPGTSVKVKGVAGLDGTASYEYIVAARTSNVYYGYEAKASDTKFWFSDDADTFRLKIQYAAGVQVAFPDEISLVTIAKA